ncbi:DUF2759 family protein [Halobacillus sp. ACCC02827]|uniref:DUF2759 family protein n=1 Tax=Bacillaceae TaxID=186817 RepID=UPI0002A51AA5|nr:MULTISPECIES: DUF2759 family protein [Bacillaceae]ELK46224.1 hypothetical protein D479_11446 [Halobacillus sp. BAB-2008]QHT47156.1 DUF2759 domain-containing protein [Bacillus sp. SB49]WJE14385.1 DUF2759 family protein [Halobacillus sp. ACCC02827]
MVTAILLLLATILCIFAVLRELKTKNFFAVVFAGASALVFGWFSVMTIWHNLFVA